MYANMAAHDLEITVDPSGQVKVEVRGIKGQACSPVIGELERELAELGAEILDGAAHAEMYLSAGQPGQAVQAGSASVTEARAAGSTR